MTTKEAQEQTGIPRRVILRAIKRNWIAAEKVKGKWQLDLNEIQKKREGHSDLICDKRTIVVRSISNFIIQSRTVERFATTSAAEEFKTLFNKKT